MKKLEKRLESFDLQWFEATRFEDALYKRCLAVQFDIWIRGYDEKPIIDRAMIAFFQLILGPLKLLAWIPFAFLEWLPKIIVAFGVALALVMSQIVTPSAVSLAALFFITFLAFYVQWILRGLRFLLFNFCDLVTLGHASVAFGRRNLLVAMADIDGETSRMQHYLLCSRPLFDGKYEKELVALGSFIEKNSFAPEIINRAIHGYWDSEAGNDQYWQDLLLEYSTTSKTRLGSNPQRALD